MRDCGLRDERVSASVALQQLASLLIFSGLAPEDLATLHSLADGLDLRPAELLFMQGEVADAFFVVLAGGLDLTVRGSNGAEQLLAHVGPGAVIGEISLLVKGPRSVTAQATEPTALLRFPDQAFRDLLDAGSLAAYGVVHNLAKVLAVRLRAADAQIAELCKNGPAAQVVEDDLDRLRKIFFTDWGLSGG